MNKIMIALIVQSLEELALLDCGAFWNKGASKWMWAFMRKGIQEVIRRRMCQYNGPYICLTGG